MEQIEAHELAAGDTIYMEGEGPYTFVSYNEDNGAMTFTDEDGNEDWVFPNILITRDQM